MSTLPLCPKLAPLCRYLDSLTGRMNLEDLEQVLLEHPISIDDVRAGCIFDETHYQRNKVAYTEWYDLLLICWRPGQATAIHDHTNSSCGFKILSGVGSEIVYEKTDSNSDTLLVSPVRKRAYSTGQLCLAQDQDIHKIANDSPSEDLVTLHIYSPPLQMKFYEVEPAFQLPDGTSSNTELGRILSGRRA